jgi:hypothetical protein
MRQAPDKAKILAKLQEEQVPWVKHNFGDRPGWMPLLGMVEELGEYVESIECGCAPKVMDDKVRDALADCVVFFCDYCSAEGLDAGELWNGAAPMTVDGGRIPLSLLACVGRLAHSYLKRAQGIRGNENHREETRRAMVYMMAHLYRMAQSWEKPFDLIAETDKVWQEVKKRDWKKDPLQAGVGSDHAG